MMLAGILMITQIHEGPATRNATEFAPQGAPSAVMVEEVHPENASQARSAQYHGKVDGSSGGKVVEPVGGGLAKLLASVDDDYVQKNWKFAAVTDRQNAVVPGRNSWDEVWNEADGMRTSSPLAQCCQQGDDAYNRGEISDERARSSVLETFDGDQVRARSDRGLLTSRAGIRILGWLLAVATGGLGMLLASGKCSLGSRGADTVVSLGLALAGLLVMAKTFDLLV